MPDTLERIPPGESPLYAQVRARLIEAIAAGEWRPGEAIPSEADLARAFGVAIGTIRKAVDALVAERALVRRQGRGTFVTAHEGSRLLFHFFHIVAGDGRKVVPQVSTVGFERDRATRQTAAALAIAPHDKVIRIRNVLSLEGRARIV
ncbi:MAG TPA: GntR family transcriptional regulator, partial [Usitatibacter sp.]|nr:GntR family transcriptional regulator [Usitatibacter sp.]